MVAPAMATIPLESAVWAALHDVHDPEIPTISVVDLGVIGGVTAEEGRIRVELLPTFVGCPAINVMQESIAERLREFADDVSVDVSFTVPWTTERITANGRAALRAAGFAPPGDPGDSGDDIKVECPYCRSRNTRIENVFGPTLCRAIYYCPDCRQPFEQFKEV